MNWPAWAIWILNALLQWGLLTIVLRRKAWRQHPAFTFYIAFLSCKTMALMWIVLFLPSAYFAVNWGSRLAGLILLIAVLVEVFAAVFRPYSTLPAGALRWFKIAFAALLLVTTAIAIYFPGATPGDLTNTILVLNRSASIIFSGAFGFTALFSSYFGIPWQQRTYGIGMGFLLFMSVDLFTSSVAAMYGMQAGLLIGVVSMSSYTLALITWITYFARPDLPPRTPTIEQMRRLQKALDYSARKVEASHGVK